MLLVGAAFVGLGTLASPVTPPGEKRGAIPPLVEVIGPYIEPREYLQTRVRARFLVPRSSRGSTPSRLSAQPEALQPERAE